MLHNGVLVWNEWRAEHPRVLPDLRGAALPAENLRGYDLRGADLRGASLVAASLRRADLRKADLSGCDLRYCDWRGARLSRARLHEARGLDEAIEDAAGRAEWLERLPPSQLKRAALAAALLLGAWALAERSYPEGVSTRAAAPAIGLAATMSQAGLTDWAVEGVAISGGLMRLRLNAEEISQDAYLETLRAACREVDSRTLTPPVRRIEILQQDGNVGWLFDDTQRCKDVLDAPSDRLSLVAAATSLPIRPKPSPDGGS